MKSVDSSPTLILIHGAWHDARCWDRLVPILNARHHKVIAPDLPGHGNNTYPLRRISLKTYSRYIIQLIDNIDNKFILIGHSMAGMLISQVAEQVPEKIAGLIYLSAYLPRDKQSLFDLMAEYRFRSGETAIEKALQMSADKHSCTISNDRIIPLFYHDCSKEDQAEALKHICSQASLPLANKVSLSQARFGRIPKHYIRCSEDRVIPDIQYQMMLEQQACCVHMLNSGHSPFLSKPEELATVLENALPVDLQ